MPWFKASINFFLMKVRPSIDLGLFFVFKPQLKFRTWWLGERKF
jgi:hypothetical protein